jgi:hypothetical protein
MKQRLPINLINQTLGPRETVFRRQLLNAHKARRGPLENARLLGQTFTAARYLPLTRQPDSQLVSSAAAVLETILEYNGTATHIYLDIVNIWPLPGCQELIEDARLNRADTQIIINALVNNEPLPAWPTLEKICNSHRDNQDIQLLVSRTFDFILQGCNKPDIPPKVLPENAPALIEVILLRSLYAHLKVELDTSDLDLVAAKDSRQRRQVIAELKANGYKLRKDRVYLDRAWKWYQSRVVFDGPEEFCRTLYNTSEVWLWPDNVNNEIKECDYAVGYPRRGS